MKKFALALACLVSVAFFASCEKQGQPTISALTEEGYVQSGDVVDLNTEVNFGFVMASSAETSKALSKLVVNIDGVEWANVDLTGKTEFTYTDNVTYSPERDIVGTSVIEAIVTDVAGETATAVINLSINEPAQPLVAATIEWVRKGTQLLGTTGAEMEAMGLQWAGSYKEVFATIKPVEGAALYVCNGDDYETITTDVEKGGYFSNLRENGTTVESYRNITTNASHDYNDMLAVIDADGQYHLVLINRAEIDTGNYGTQITIIGEAK